MSIKDAALQAHEAKAHAARLDQEARAIRNRQHSEEACRRWVVNTLGEPPDLIVGSSFGAAGHGSADFWIEDMSFSWRESPGRSEAPCTLRYHERVTGRHYNYRSFGYAEIRTLADLGKALKTLAEKEQKMQGGMDGHTRTIEFDPRPDA